MSNVVNFPKKAKARRETKRDVAERILPKVFGILATRGAGEHDGYTMKVYYTPGVVGRGGPIAIVEVSKGSDAILEVWLYQEALGYRNEVFEGRGWLRQMDFKGRASWVPELVKVEAPEMGFGEFLSRVPTVVAS